MKEKIIDTLRTLGFLLEKIEDFGYGFQYDGINFIWIPDNDDEEFLNIGIPEIAEKSEMDEVTFYQLPNKLNSTLKYVKAYPFGNSIWLFYERELLEEEENLERVITRMILRLESAIGHFNKMLEETTNNLQKEEADSDPTNYSDVMEEEYGNDD